MERIQAIARFVQNDQLHLDSNGHRDGGGYSPHSAAEVFAKSYGDCKDKANLMRAMLKVAEHTRLIRAHLFRRPDLCARGVAFAATVQSLHHRHQSQRRDESARPSCGTLRSGGS